MIGRVKDKTGLSLSSVGEPQPHLMGVGERDVHCGMNKPVGAVRTFGIFMLLQQQGSTRYPQDHEEATRGSRAEV